MNTPLLRVDGLTVSYRAGRSREPHTAVSGVSFDIERGEVLALVGESGSGKTTIGGAISGLLPAGATIDSGTVQLQVGGKPLTVSKLADRAMSECRGRRVALVPQDPGVSLNPVQRIGASIASSFRIHARRVPRWRDDRQVRTAVLELLERVGLDDPERRAKQYPHELSGGMRQRVLIAGAIALGPDLIIADEPTSALDTTVQRRILDLLDELRREMGSSVLLITHDLAVAAERADRLAVLRGGTLEEIGATSDVLAAPTHPYTRLLLSDAPGLNAIEPKAERSPAAPHVSVTDLVHEYGDGSSRFRAVDGVSFEIERGTTHALVGESGSGKTTIGRAVAALHAATSGTITIGGTSVHGPTRDRSIRRTVQLVSQNPYGSLDPRRTIAQTIGEPLRNWSERDGGVRRRDELAARVREALDQVALPQDVAKRLPKELSGGQRQRVAIARALILKPEVVVLDEAVSALDVTVQSQILDLLESLQHDLGLTYLFITHDLSVVRRIADSVTVLRRGVAVESGSAKKVLTAPKHEYTLALLAAVPTVRLEAPGRQPATSQLQEVA